MDNLTIFTLKVAYPLLKKGKTNKQIAEIYGLHDRYVSLIRHKKRYTHLWEQIKDYTPIKSMQQLKSRGRITEEMFVDIVDMINNGKSNVDIERKYNLSAGTGSRIRHKKLYKQWWILLENNELLKENI